MNIREMHFDVKKRLGKIDSQKYRNLQIPEIDWSINEGLEVCVKSILYPKFKQAVERQVGVELNQRNIDDLRTIVVNQATAKGTCQNMIAYDATSYTAPIPDEYWYHLSTYVLAKKGNCETLIRATVRQHDDLHEESLHTVSSYEWRETNARFFEDGLRVFTDGTFTLSKACINYVKHHPWMHNAQDFEGGTYNRPNGEVLIGSQDCILPKHMHREVVNFTVLLLTGELQMPDYMIKKDRIAIIN